jgi:hypothetical protein
VSRSSPATPTLTDVDEDGNLTLYKVACKIAFIYERGSEGGV